jgi:hypothetical protein
VFEGGSRSRFKDFAVTAQFAKLELALATQSSKVGLWRGITQALSITHSQKQMKGSFLLMELDNL